MMRRGRSGDPVSTQVGTTRGLAFSVAIRADGEVDVRVVV
jgi:hypothetical protein